MLKIYEKYGLSYRNPWIKSVLLLRIECSCALSGHLFVKDARDKNPALRSFLACAGLPMRVPLWGTEPF
jgi:hypothetical protein